MFLCVDICRAVVCFVHSRSGLTIRVNHQVYKVSVRILADYALHSCTLHLTFRFQDKTQPSHAGVFMTYIIPQNFPHACPRSGTAFGCKISNQQ